MAGEALINIRSSVVHDPPILPPSTTRDWLRYKTGAEKGFSLGFFGEAYLRRFPVADTSALIAGGYRNILLK